jgi:CspA family cold shock protein
MLATVRERHDEEGWGVLVGDDFPDPIWTHFSAISDQADFRSLTPGERVDVEVIGPDDFDGFRYRAETVRSE